MKLLHGPVGVHFLSHILDRMTNYQLYDVFIHVKDLFESMGIIDAKDKASRFYAIMYFYYSIYDGAVDKEKVKEEVVLTLNSIVQELK